MYSNPDVGRLVFVCIGVVVVVGLGRRGVVFQIFYDVKGEKKGYFAFYCLN